MRLGVLRWDQAEVAAVGQERVAASCSFFDMFPGAAFDLRTSWSLKTPAMHWSTSPLAQAFTSGSRDKDGDSCMHTHAVRVRGRRLQCNVVVFTRSKRGQMRPMHIRADRVAQDDRRKLGESEQQGSVLN